MSKAGGQKKTVVQRLSLSVIMTVVVVTVVSFACCVGITAYLRIYRASVEGNAITGSEQAIKQVHSTLENYAKDIEEIMGLIRSSMGKEEGEKDDFLRNLVEVRKEVVIITEYDNHGNLTNCWQGDNRLKEKILQNLSYMEIPKGEEGLFFSSPHVESLIENYYPWVVTIAQRMKNHQKEEVLVCMDIRFSNIASYVDNVGIGQHGYCFIMDGAGGLVYHPQQQLIHAGLKSENWELLTGRPDGAFLQEDGIYTIQSMENNGWKIVGVSFVDEMITSKLDGMAKIIGFLLFSMLLATLLVGIFSSKLVSSPANKLMNAMQQFEKDAENFTFCQVNGTREIAALSDSFGHMVVQIQNLMEQVRREEVTLRKTELNALQAQINPHFLYNTLDSIAWMCEEGRTKEAITMVNALARLFRISISRGHELITIEKECQHAESYLKIQKYRYKNRFTYQFDVEEECLGYFCNKITLQPIIENAINHGLDMCDEGRICIGVRRRGEDILMYVEDNGVGMEEDRCREILHREASDRTGIGIKNVNDRIRIYFGEKYGLHIESELDVGTRVEICIPCLQEEIGTEG